MFQVQRLLTCYSIHINIYKIKWNFPFISYVLLTLHPNLMTVFLFFTNLIQKLFILIHLLYSCTCFEHYYAHLQEGNCISTAVGIVTLFR